MTPAPTLTTARLTLRGPEAEDLSPFTDWLSGSDRLGFLGGNADAKSAKRGFLAGIGHWHFHGYGFFTVCAREDGTPLGRVGLLDHLDFPDQPELAWHLFDGAEGKGHAFEAAVAVRRWFGDRGGTQLISLVDLRNARSMALAQRLGARIESQTRRDGEDVMIFRHLSASDPKAEAQWAEVAP